MEREMEEGGGVGWRRIWREGRMEWEIEGGRKEREMEREMEEVGGVDGEGDGRGRRGRILRKQGECIKIIYYMANSFILTLIRLRRGGGGIGLGLFKFFTFNFLLTNTGPSL